MIEVVNIKTYSMKGQSGTHVYIGRKMPNRPGSLLGNPFKPKSYTDEQARQECLALYRDWLAKQELSRSEAWYELRRLAEIAKMDDLYLACWCAPQSCHGDVLKAEIERLNTEEQ
jgi:hypothetical protein